METACVCHAAEALTGFATGDLVSKISEPRLGAGVGVGEIETNRGATEVSGDEFGVLEKGSAQTFVAVFVGDAEAQDKILIDFDGLFDSAEIREVD